MIVVACSCGQVLRASEAFADTKVTCPGCRKAVHIPSAAHEPPSDDEQRPSQTTPPQETGSPRHFLLLVALLALAVCVLVGLWWYPETLRYFDALLPRQP